MDLLTIEDVGARVARSLDAEFLSMDITFEQTSSVRSRLASALEARILRDNGGEEFDKHIDLVPVLLKTLSDQDRAQNAVVSAKLRKQENATAIEASRIISDALAAEESVRAIPSDISAPPPIPEELVQLIAPTIKSTELKTDPMDFTGE